MTDPKHILLSRTDGIGDVVLTLPMAGFLKQRFPQARISFIGNTYTQSVVALSAHIHGFVNWDLLKEEPESDQVRWLRQLEADWIVHVFPNREIAGLARKAGIPNRVGTSHRWFHWFTCNRNVHFSRRRSELHESQLNMKLLKPLGVSSIPPLAQIQAYFGFSNLPAPTPFIQEQIDPDRFNLILHPKSRGSAREWGESNFGELVNLLPEDRFKIFVNGTRKEGDRMRQFLNRAGSRVVDLTGKLNLSELISFLSMADGLVAASTGPLHIAAALGKKTVGLYAPMRPIHPGRWAPLGKDAHVLVKDQDCEDCRKSMDCACIRGISPADVMKKLEE